MPWATESGALVSEMASTSSRTGAAGVGGESLTGPPGWAHPTARRLVSRGSRAASRTRIGRGAPAPRRGASRRGPAGYSPSRADGSSCTSGGWSTSRSCWPTSSHPLCLPSRRSWCRSCCGRPRMWHSIPRSSATSCSRCLKTPCRHDAPASARRPGRFGPGSSGTAPHRIPHAVEAWHSSFATPEWFATLRHVGVRQSCSTSPRGSRCRHPPSPAPRAPTAGIAARRSPRRAQGGESPGRRRRRSEPSPTPENALPRGPSSGTSPGP